MLIGTLAAIGAAATLVAQAPEPTAGTASSPASSALLATAAAATPGLSDDDKIVCRSQRFTGSRFPQRTCRTKKEWREWKTRKRRDYEDFEARGRPKSNNPEIRY